MTVNEILLKKIKNEKNVDEEAFLITCLFTIESLEAENERLKMEIKKNE